MTLIEVPGAPKLISVTAGAVVRSLISALVAGVVTEMTLPPHGITPRLAADDAAPIIKEPCLRAAGAVFFLRTCALQTGSMTQVAISMVTHVLSIFADGADHTGSCLQIVTSDTAAAVLFTGPQALVAAMVTLLTGPLNLPVV